LTRNQPHCKPISRPF